MRSSQSYALGKTSYTTLVLAISPDYGRRERRPAPQESGGPGARHADCESRKEIGRAPIMHLSYRVEGWTRTPKLKAVRYFLLARRSDVENITHEHDIGAMQ